MAFEEAETPCSLSSDRKTSIPSQLENDYSCPSNANKLPFAVHDDASFEKTSESPSPFRKETVIEFEFDEDDPLYECFCSLMHVKTGTYIFCCILVVGGTIGFSSAFIFKLTSIMRTFVTCYSAWNVGAGICSLNGLWRGCPRSFFSLILLSITSLILWGSMLICFMVMAFTMDKLALYIVNAVIGIPIGYTVWLHCLRFHSWRRTIYISWWNTLDEMMSRTGTILFGMCGFALLMYLLSLWQLRVSFQCYNYLLDAEDNKAGRPLGLVPTIDAYCEKECSSKMERQGTRSLSPSEARSGPNPLIGWHSNSTRRPTESTTT